MSFQKYWVTGERRRSSQSCLLSSPNKLCLNTGIGLYDRLFSELANRLYRECMRPAGCATGCVVYTHLNRRQLRPPLRPHLECRHQARVSGVCTHIPFANLVDMKQNRDVHGAPRAGQRAQLHACNDYNYIACRLHIKRCKVCDIIKVMAISAL